MKRRWKLVILAVLGIVLLWLYRSSPLTAEAILGWQPDNLFLAAAVLMLLYAVKSMLVFVPILIPQILAGHLYPREVALGLNLLGLVIVMSVPYLIGKRLDHGRIDRILEKYPKLKGIIAAQNDNELAVCFMLRSCAVPPADIVTMYLGASGVSYGANVIGGVLGSLPFMVLTTFLGERIHDPSSPLFWKALLLNITWIVLSALGFFLLKRFGAKEEPM